MSDLKPSDLNAEERAIVDAAFLHRWDDLGFAIVAAMRALFAPAKEEEHEAGVLTDENATVHRSAPPSEKPEAVTSMVTWRNCPACGKEVRVVTYKSGGVAVDLHGCTTSQPAPAAVMLTPELERVLNIVHLESISVDFRSKLNDGISRDLGERMRSDIAAVRAQAEQAQRGR